MGCMRACPCLSHLKVVADLDDHNNVYWLSPVGSKPYSSRGLGGHSPSLQRRTGSISLRVLQALRCPPCSATLWENEDVLHEGYRPKMLLYALEELFYIYDQVNCHGGINEKLVVAYEILGLATLHCMEC